ncbi:MAG TPA: aspartyl/asparaginyl beta-hydroxylase domain-containing protein [Sphingomicrobium sp.]|nr:aspartyl/asparaginyl beta-hydroxylase domain-containing protein [Sphingomicrobium sp.]
MIQLDKPFYKLPIRFAADVLASEVHALGSEAWTPHPTGFVGNEAVRLVTPGGLDSDAMDGPMAPTPHLLSCPYTLEVMAALGGVWGRSRFMGLGPGAEVPEHIDASYYWRTHLRIHIPVITNPGVIFTCGGTPVHMAAGECWAFDSFRLHDVQNKGSEQRVHLVIDTVGSDKIWELMEHSIDLSAEAQLLIEPGSVDRTKVAFEQFNRPKLMSAWELKTHIAFLLDHSLPDPALEAVKRRLDRFIFAWQGAWAMFADNDAGIAVYRQLLDRLRGDLQQIGGGHILLDNTETLYFFLDRMVFSHAVVPPTRMGVVTAGRSNQRLAS